MNAISREVVGTFHDARTLEGAANALMSNGFDRSALSLVAPEETVRKHFGALLKNVEKLEDHPDTPRIAYMDHDDVAIARGALISGLSYLGAVTGSAIVLTSGGALLPAVVIAAAGGLGGGGLGAMVGSWLEAETGKKITDEVQRGGLILWVRTHSIRDDARATGTMNSNGAYDVHAHADGEQSGMLLSADTPLVHPDQTAGQDTDIERRLMRDPGDVDAQLDRGLDESMDASDPPAAVMPGDSGDPLPSSGFNPTSEEAAMALLKAGRRLRQD
ncbi:MAG: hypothetical protein JWO15_1585 [Sphingomonadales bacterium]|nr:hypothetical protein [Sphingomonadales bacterium]